MGPLFAKMDINLDSHPKIRKAGRDGREVFLFILRKNAALGRGGKIPASYVDPEYLAEQLMVTVPEARSGLERCVTADLLLVTDLEVGISGWDEGWSGRAMTEAERKAKQRSKTRESRAGDPDIQTYIIVQDGLGFFKVGKTQNVGARAAELQTGSAVQLRIVHVEPGDHEGRMHDALAEHRASGEWFRGSDDVLQRAVTLLSSRDRDCPDSHAVEKRREEKRREEERGAGAPASPPLHGDPGPAAAPPGQSAWHRRQRWWAAMLDADARIRLEGIEANALTLPKSPAGPNEQNMARCERQLLDAGYSAADVDSKMHHIVLVAEAEAIREKSRKWFKPALIWDPERANRAVDTSLDEAKKPRAPPSGPRTREQQTSMPRPERFPPATRVSEAERAAAAEIAKATAVILSQGKPS